MVSGFTALHVAAQFGKTSVMGYLVARGQPVDTVDVAMMTPLMWSVSKVRREVGKAWGGRGDGVSDTQREETRER